MAQETLSRATSLALAATIIIINLLSDADGEAVGIMQGVSLFNRITYSFFHASFLHAFMNVWCLLSIVFIYPISIWSLIVAFGIAASFPVDTLCGISPIFCFTIPTIGLSGVCFALMGRISFMVSRKWYYQGWLIFYLILGFLFPNTNGWLHLYCYLMGMLVGFLNKPLKC